jgi:glycine cleavage system pyridoxal-binding protein P
LIESNTVQVPVCTVSLFSTGVAKIESSRLHRSMRYIPNSPEEREEMLASVGLANAAELFRSIPQDIQLGRKLEITDPLAEIEVIAELERMAARNTAATKPSFLGAGVYSHYSPTIVDHLIQRSEFFTSYTPYQPEVSQGTLQYIFEFQTLVCQLTGMEVANASMYDGSTATAEAYLMAQRVTRRDKIVVAETVHPEYREVAKTYAQHGDTEVVTVRRAIAKLLRLYRRPQGLGCQSARRWCVVCGGRHGGDLVRPAQDAGRMRSGHRGG